MNQPLHRILILNYWFVFIFKKDIILLNGVGEPFLEQNIRYHCPIYCVFNFNKTVTASYVRHIWLYDWGITKLFLMILDKQIGIKLRVTMLTNMLKI